jgi:hypothetical protein
LERHEGLRYVVKGSLDGCAALRCFAEDFIAERVGSGELDGLVVGHEATMGSTKTGRSRVIELDAGTVAVLRQQWKRQAEDRLRKHRPI